MKEQRREVSFVGLPSATLLYYKNKIWILCNGIQKYIQATTFYNGNY